MASGSISHSGTRNPTAVAFQRGARGGGSFTAGVTGGGGGRGYCPCSLCDPNAAKAGPRHSDRQVPPWEEKDERDGKFS